MERQPSGFYLSRSEEKKLLGAAAAAVETDFPNPERIDCPEPRSVRDLARRRIPITETAGLVDHIATCAPCFDAYSRFRRQCKRVRAGSVVVVAVTGILALTLWRPHVSSLFPYRQPTAMVNPSTPSETATVDFRELSPTRSAEPQRHNPQTPRLRNVKLDLTVLLPFGTEDGEYSIEVRNASGEVVVQAVGRARWNGTAETLATKLDLRNLPAGRCTMALRASGSAWHVYPLILGDVN